MLPGKCVFSQNFLLRTADFFLKYIFHVIGYIGLFLYSVQVKKNKNSICIYQLSSSVKVERITSNTK